MDENSAAINNNPRWTGRRMKVSICVVLTVVVVALIATVVLFLLPAKSRGTSTRLSPPSARSRVREFTNAAVAVDAPDCAEIGARILKNNGSVVDAAIATSLCTGVMNRAGSGIGGGFIATYYDRTAQKLYSIDARETAPLASYSTMYTGKPSDASTLGVWAIGTPSVIAGYYELHKRFGRLPWSSLFEPTIKLCEDGMKISSWISLLLGSRIRQQLDAFPFLKQLFVVNGEFGKEGALVKDLPLAQTLKRIASDPETFNRGSLADDIVSELKEDSRPQMPSLITVDDLRNYTVKWREPLKLAFRVSKRNFTIAFFPPPSSSAVLALAINVMGIYRAECLSANTNATSCPTLDDPTMLHRLIEAIKYAFAHRSKLGDPDFVNNTETIRRLMDSAFAGAIRLRINDSYTHTNLSEYHKSISYLKPDDGTSQLSIIDASGNAISMTSTVNGGFGSMVRGKKTGIIYNNEMNDFSQPNATNHFGIPRIPGSEENYVQPGKRPLSSMSPIIVLDENGDVVLVTGSVGGVMILTGVLHPLLRNLLFEEQLAAALDAPRLHHQLLPNTIFHPTAYSPAMLAEMAARGHNFTTHPYLDLAGAVQCIRVYRDQNNANKRIQAASDYRRIGSQAGY